MFNCRFNVQGSKVQGL